MTDFVLPAPQENVIAARVDNAWNYKEKATGSGFQWNDRNFFANYGGINKNVFLHVTDKLHQTLPPYSDLGTTGVYVYATDFDLRGRAATVTAESQVRNENAAPQTFSYTVIIEDARDRAVKTFGGETHTLAPGERKMPSASARLGGLNFWGWGYGHLDDVHTVLKVGGRAADVLGTRTGFRKTEFGAAWSSSTAA